jgi:DNA-binding IclR family transcriptional regulator
MIAFLDWRADPADPAAWSEEQLRFRVLRAVCQRSGRRCARPVPGSAIGAQLGLNYEDLFRIVSTLERGGFLTSFARGATLCITPKGMAYLAAGAGRRRSVRDPDPPA